MLVNKFNGAVCFNDAAHRYWNKDDGGDYISVTTLIQRLEKPFDSAFWSAYKAAERVLSKDEWLVARKCLLESRDLSCIDLDLISDVRDKILEEWRLQNEESCTRGVNIHSKLERKFSGDVIDLKKLDISGKYTYSSSLDTENMVCPEYLISYDCSGIRIAGQIDLLVKCGNEITIIDWKTNKKINKKSYYDTRAGITEKMKYPLNNLDNCNYWVYTMQLSTYAWMVEQLCSDYVIKDLILVHFAPDGVTTRYNIDYLRSDVEKMVRWYGRSLRHDKQLQKYKKIEY